MLEEYTKYMIQYTHNICVLAITLCALYGNCTLGTDSCTTSMTQTGHEEMSCVACFVLITLDRRLHEEIILRYPFPFVAAFD